MKIKEYKLLLKDRCPYIAESGKFYNIDGRKVYNTPDRIAAFINDCIGLNKAANEHLYVCCLDNKNHLIGCFEASHGSCNYSLFPVREIFQKSLLIGAVSIVVSHNHPSGDYGPSEEDISSTKRIKAAGDIIGIGVLDHIIVAADNLGYYSFLENGQFS